MVRIHARQVTLIERLTHSSVFRGSVACSLLARFLGLELRERAGERNNASLLTPGQVCRPIGRTEIERLECKDCNAAWIVWQFTQVGRQLLRLVQRNRDEESFETFAGIFRPNRKQTFYRTSSDSEIGIPYMIDRQ
jgi:hypothetical protein